MSVLIAAAIFIAVVALILSFQFREQERAGFAKSRLARATNQAPGLQYRASPGLALRGSRISNSEAIERLLRGFHLTHSIDAKLRRSDWKIKVSDFLLISAAVGILAFVMVARLSGSYVIGGAVAMVGLFIPVFLLNRSVKKRRKAFNSQLVEVLTQIANSLKAGFGLLQAISLAIDEAKPPIAVELRQTIQDIQVGASFEDAFNDLNLRVGSEDLDIVITAILIQRGAGGNLSEILEGVTHMMRERIRIRGEIETLTSQQKLTGYLIGALPIVLGAGFFVINRSYISLLFTTNVGHGLLAGWVVLQTIGFFAIRRILNIEI